VSHAAAADHTPAPAHDTHPDAHDAHEEARPAASEPAEHEPSAPPAAIIGEPIDDAPVDDVDGPLAQRDVGELHRAMMLARMR
jgi:hypothetical protein